MTAEDSDGAETLIPAKALSEVIMPNKKIPCST